MICKKCGFVEPEFAKRNDEIDYFCPCCYKTLGTFVLLEFTSEEYHILKKKMKVKTDQDLLRNLKTSLLNAIQKFY